MPLSFHAAPPAGHWLNDPNALVETPHGWRLLAQHRAPGTAIVDWGLFSSPDLLEWTWRDVSIAASAEAYAYSGSLIRSGERLEAFHTVHDPVASLQHQVRLLAEDSSLRRWHAAPTIGLPPPRRNLRDPSVFRHGAGWRMLLAAPCDWHDWRGDPPSHLRVLASDDLATWREAGRIGPWHPPGVMWEVPVLLRAGERDLLIVSTVDRRADRAACGVRGWVGRFDGATFAPDRTEGEPIDLGPDFYALMTGVDPGSPAIGWLASWDTARALVWPGFTGGPISLPRAITVRDDCIEHRSFLDNIAFRSGPDRPSAGLGVAEIDGGEPFTFAMRTDRARLLIEGDPRTGALRIRRDAADAFAWSAEHAAVLAPAPTRTIRLFIDGPAVELFIAPDARAASIVLPGRLDDVALSVNGRSAALAWSAYPPA